MYSLVTLVTIRHIISGGTSSRLGVGLRRKVGSRGIARLRSQRKTLKKGRVEENEASWQCLTKLCAIES
jgi:hypothetical protein